MRNARYALITPLSLFIAGLCFCQAATAANEDKRVNLDNGIALHGYDPVSYFVDKLPVAGKSDLRAKNGAATYLFASPEHLEAFKKDPKKYEPQYGGWCAYAMAKADFVDIDPKSYKLQDGKLYLFYNGFWGNTLEKWNKDEGTLYPKAEESWRSLFKDVNGGK